MSASTDSHPLAGCRVVLLTAFDPWAIGNGSSMRARRWCEVLSAAAGEFDAVVVPVVGSDAASPYRRMELPDEVALVRGAAQLMEPRWREWMQRVTPLPPAAAKAPAWLGRALLADLAWRPDVVVAFKMAVAPMAADLAMECGVPLLVDIDDDEAGMEQSLGGVHAAALDRLLRGVGELADEIAVASPVDAASVANRLAAGAGPPPVRVVPNVVPVPQPAAGAGASTLPGRVLYVANFDYGPNRQSAQWLLRQVLPRVVGLHQLSVVGAFGDTLGCVPPAVAHGRVPDLAPFYADAAVVVCPVLAGSGTSIKVIEAMAHGRPVVTTSIGARGLGLVPGEHAVVVDDPVVFATAVSELLASPDAAAALGERGRGFVARHYSPEMGATAMVGAVAAALGDRRKTV